MIHELVDQVNAVLDGEIVAFDADGRNSFEALQQRMNLAERARDQADRRRDPRRAGRVRPALAGRSRHDGPARSRSAASCWSLIVEEDHRLQLMTHVEGDGKAFTEAAKALGLEGVDGQAAAARSTCPGRRSDDWRKIKLTNTQDCVILGWTPGTGRPFDDVRRAAASARSTAASGSGSVRSASGFTDRTLADRPGAAGSAGPRDTPPIDDPELAR